MNTFGMKIRKRFVIIGAQRSETLRKITGMSGGCIYDVGIPKLAASYDS